MTIRILHALTNTRFDYEFYIGPYMGRLTLSRSGSFAYGWENSWWHRHIRRYWSGWHRWAETDEF